jgi:flagellar motor switch protein FliN/FliY
MSDDTLDNLADKLAEEAAAMSDGPSSASSAASKKAAEVQSGKDHNLQLILDIPLKVTVELGRTKMPVSELLNLTQGSVIELSKLAGEPMEVLVNDKLIARGEAVVVNEKFGVRLTDIISPAERVEQLR